MADSKVYVRGCYDKVLVNGFNKRNMNVSRLQYREGCYDMSAQEVAAGEECAAN